jgi:hypothetical protein
LQKCCQQFKFYATVCPLNEKDVKVQVGILLHEACPEAVDIQATFTWNEVDNKNYQDTLPKKR